MTTFDPDKITYFAKTDARGRETTFGIKAKDRQRHMYVVGKTGMGKSTLLENMAAQDILTGEGMAFIDPHGSTAEALLDYIPEDRVDDVVYFAPFDLNHPVSFNVMEDVGPDKRHLVVSGLMSTFKKVWVDQWSARMEYILTNALLVLIEYPDTTLLSVNRLFIDKAYRNKVVDYCKDPAVKAYWTEEFANYTERFAAEALPAIQNKIGQFTGNPLIRNIIGQPHSSFDIREIMDEKKILIMNLSKGLIGETNANLLGSMLTTRIYLAAMSRADLPVEEMKQQPNFYFYVDEFQSFANATFANILSEARKYHLNLIIAHQYIAQMEEEVRDAVFGNVGTTVSFRVGPFDGEVLETVFAPRFEAADLVNLGFAQIYLTLMIDGIGSQPFSATTLPPVQRPHKSSRNQVVSRSRELYADDRAKVEKVVDDLHMPTITPGGNKKNNGKGKQKPGGQNAKGFKKNGPANSGPQTPDELKAVLAKVAGENGGSKPSDKKPDDTDSAETKQSDNQTDSSTNKDSKTTSPTQDNKKNSDEIIPETFADVEAAKEAEAREKERQAAQAEEKEAAAIKAAEKRVQAAREQAAKEEAEEEAKKAADQSKNEQQSQKDDAKQTERTAKEEASNTKQAREQNDRQRNEQSKNGNQAHKKKSNKKKNSQHHNHHQSKQRHEKHEKRRDSTNETSSLKDALREVLEQVEKKQHTETKVETFADTKPAPKKAVTGPTPTVRIVKPVTQKVTEVPAKTVVDPKNVVPPAPVAKTEKENPLDAKKIKKMLQTSKHEKSPMNT